MSDEEIPDFLDNWWRAKAEWHALEIIGAFREKVMTEKEAESWLAWLMARYTNNTEGLAGE